MRLPTDTDREFESARETIAAALAAGVTVFDTARAYGDGEGANERLLADALAQSDARHSARVITKGGMSRAGGAWVPDGRAKTIARDCEASLGALDGMPIDMYLIHAPDPRTPWRTTVRALARLLEQGLVSHVGLSNVNRAQLDEALEIAPVAAVEVALSINDQRAVRGGIVERCDALGIAIIAHSPLGGPRRVGALLSTEALNGIATARDATAAEVALAWLLGLSPAVIAIPGARRPETARSAASAATLELGQNDRLALDGAFDGPRQPRPRAAGTREDAEVVIVMGIPGAGKSTRAAAYVACGYIRLNRDERGSSLREIADELDTALASGSRRVVLDNTYLTRSSRSYVIEAAARHGIATRCIWYRIPLARAQVNLVIRLLERFDTLPQPDELRKLSRTVPGVLTPTSQMRTLRELEEPSHDEGFAAIEVVHSISTRPAGLAAGVLVAAAALRSDGWETAVQRAAPAAPHLIFDWSPDGAPEQLEPDVQRLAAVITGSVQAALCPHAAGPPVCWCRPPLPGLALAFARASGLDRSRLAVVGCRPTDRTLADALAAEYFAV